MVLSEGLVFFGGGILMAITGVVGLAISVGVSPKQRKKLRKKISEEYMR